MWFILTPVLVYLGVGVLACLVLIVEIIRECGLVYVVDVGGIPDTFRCEGVSEGVKRVCSGLFWLFVITVVCVFVIPALIGVSCFIAILEPEFEDGAVVSENQ